MSRSHSKTQAQFRIYVPSRGLVQTAACLFFPLAALAQTGAKPGYLLDGQGGFVHSGTPGQCWHTGEWTPALAQPECDLALKPITVAAAPVVAPVPPPVVQTPVAVAAPKVVPVVVAPPPAQTMHYASDTLFGFDKFSIGLAGKKVLDDASVNILSLKGEKVDVVGHADRIGSADYNQKLSLKRADAVRDYLVTKGVPAERMVTRGAGETEPVTKPGICAAGSSAKVIACLQPDRRVDIEVQGTKIATP
jgi:OOP family OmpA-OmpF porin